MTKEKSHPPIEPFPPDPTREGIRHRRDPAKDLPTDPIRFEEADQDGHKADNLKQKARIHSLGLALIQPGAELPNNTQRRAVKVIKISIYTRVLVVE